MFLTLFVFVLYVFWLLNYFEFRASLIIVNLLVKPKYKVIVSIIIIFIHFKLHYKLIKILCHDMHAYTINFEKNIVNSD